MGEYGRVNQTSSMECFIAIRQGLQTGAIDLQCTRRRATTDRLKGEIWSAEPSAPDLDHLGMNSCWKSLEIMVYQTGSITRGVR